jgi:uncharacterized iron-regulated protein
MGLLQKLIIGVMVCLPATAWSADLHYALDVKINTSEQKISGIARLISDADTKITLSVLNLRKLKVDGKAVAADESISLTVLSSKETLISYEALFTDNKANFISKENVFLTGGWYPRPDDRVEYALSVTLPKDFIAVSEADAITVKKHGKTKIFKFQFKHPLDTLHLAASTRYILKKDRYNNIAIETYFFKEDAHLAGAYISHTKKYLEMYETMLTPYPYHRFAIVENIFPTGNSMPTFTLLGNRVVRLPFIIKTSLGHEILHEWFGNSVYIDFAHGNWSEGLTAYLADHYYAELEGKDTAYRKQIMVDYNAYVNADKAFPVSDFYSSRNKAENAIGYGKTAMLFHKLRKRYGDKYFFAAIRDFIQQNSFRAASWHDIQRAFEKVTGEKLYAEFDQWLNHKDIPQLGVEDEELLVERGQLKLKLTLLQQSEPYLLSIPFTLFTESDKSLRFVEVKDSENKIDLELDEPPTKVVIDENYTIMRQLTPAEIPPVLASIMGKEKLIVIASANRRAIYQPLIDALGVENITYVSPEDLTFTQLKDNSFLITGYDNTLVNTLFGKQAIPGDGVRLKVYKNPYNEKERIALFHAKNKAEIKAVKHKIPHYGKYTEIAFNEGKNTHKRIAETVNGIQIFSRPETLALKPEKQTTLHDIIPEFLGSRIIYVGEKHDRFAHHINQLQVIKRIHEAGYKLAVGMEMFQRPFQQAVDDYLAGRIDEHAFLKKSEYFNKWRYDYNLYKPIVDYLKHQNIPIVALNIQGDITRKVARKGIYSLTDEEKKQVPGAMDFSNEQYRSDLDKVFTLHAGKSELNDFNFFLQAQALWDEGMAESAHQFLVNNPEHKLVILAGNGHLSYKYGIPERLHQRNQEPFTVLVQDEIIEDGIADYVLLTEELKGKKTPLLGVTVEEKDQGLVVIGVNNKSPAKKAGLQEGDIIKQFAGQSIKSLVDLKFALFYSEIGSPLKIQVNRADKLLDKDIELFHF